MRLTEAERIALSRAKHPFLISDIPDKTTKDCLGDIDPGMRIYQGLIKKNLIFFTEEDPIDIDGEPFEFTPSVYLTAEGEKLLEITT